MWPTGFLLTGSSVELLSEADAASAPVVVDARAASCATVEPLCGLGARDERENADSDLSPIARLPKALEAAPKASEDGPGKL